MSTVTELKIEKFRYHDLDEMISIEQISFPDPWTRQMFVRELSLPFSNFYVAKDNQSGKILGYAGYWQSADETHILNIAVAPEYRKQGVGKKLLQYMIEESMQKKMKTVWLEVRESNIVAQQMYLKSGFEIVGRREKYYPNKESAILMSKTI